MNKPFFGFKMTRRQGLSAAAGAMGSQPPQASICLLQRSMRTGLIHRPAQEYGVKGRTIDAHAHILGGPNQPEPRRPLTTRVGPNYRPSRRNKEPKLSNASIARDSTACILIRLSKRIFISASTPGGLTLWTSHDTLSTMQPSCCGKWTTQVLTRRINTPDRFAAPMRTTGPVDPSTEAIEQLMLTCSDTCKKYSGRFIPFIGIDLRRGPGADERLERRSSNTVFAATGKSSLRCGARHPTITQRPTLITKPVALWASRS